VLRLAAATACAWAAAATLNDADASWVRLRVLVAGDADVE
jgi:hypothetical protein